MSSILIYSPAAGPRMRYIMTEMLCRMSGFQIEFCSDEDFFRKSHAPKINYSHNPLSADALHVVPHGLLEESGIRDQPGLMLLLEQGQSFSKKNKLQLPAEFSAGKIEFDLFSAGFYLLSRYEEYLPFKADVHGRFPATESVAFRFGFLQKPLVQEWASAFAALLSEKYPQLKVVKPPFRKLLTVDVDQAFKYRHKPWWRIAAGLLKYPNTFRERMAVWMGLQSDPFDIFGQLETYFSDKDAEISFFILIGNYGPFDKNTDHRSSTFRNIIKKLAEKYPVGIHPSYASSSADYMKSQMLLANEIERLQAVAETPVLRSRQHFLKLRFPVTYRKLLQAGISDDFSMGYADQIGFRASTALPFFWYDLQAESTTDLLVHPFQVMDVTLRDYLKLSPEKANESVREMRQLVERFGGEFTIIWHNSSFDNSWEGWSPHF